MAGIETLADADAVIGCTARRSYFDPRAASDLTADMARRAPALVVPMSGLGRAFSLPPPPPHDTKPPAIAGLATRRPSWFAGLWPSSDSLASRLTTNRSTLRSLN
jgi:hypothetical protein